MMNLFRRKATPGQVRALFLHIQKTAGTSIVHLARQYYGENLTSHGDCWNFEPGQLNNVGFVSGHIGYQYAKSLMRNRYSFTFLRDPAERILSMYFFCRSRNPNEFEIYEKAHEFDLLGFLEAGQSDACIRNNIWNNQVWQLAHGYTHLDTKTVDDYDEADLLDLAKQHLQEFSFIGFTETFESDARVILAALGLPGTRQMPMVNDSPGRPSLGSVSAEVRLSLDRLTALDRQLYRYAGERRWVAKNSRDRR